MSGPAPSARLFAALELGPALRDGLAAWGRLAASGDPALRPLPGPALHVTLHFLGDRPADEVPALRAAVAAVSPSPVTQATAGALWLAPRRPHVLTCAVTDVEGRLDALHGALGAALARATADWRAERRALRPHVTVARVRRGARPEPQATPPAPALRERAPAVLLVRSHLGPAGAAYETLERRPLHSRS